MWEASCLIQCVLLTWCVNLDVVRLCTLLTEKHCLLLFHSITALIIGCSLIFLLIFLNELIWEIQTNRYKESLYLFITFKHLLGILFFSISFLLFLLFHAVTLNYKRLFSLNAAILFFCAHSATLGFSRLKQAWNMVSLNPLSCLLSFVLVFLSDFTEPQLKPLMSYYSIASILY